MDFGSNIGRVSERAERIIDKVLTRSAELGDIHGRRAQSQETGRPRARTSHEIWGRFTRALARVFEPVLKTDASFRRLQLRHAVEDFTAELGATLDRFIDPRSAGAPKEGLGKTYASALRAAAAMPDSLRDALMTRILEKHVSGLLPNEISALTEWLNTADMPGAKFTDDKFSASRFVDSFKAAALNRQTGHRVDAVVTEVLSGVAMDSRPEQVQGLLKGQPAVPADSVEDLFSQEISALSKAFASNDAPSAVETIRAAWEARIADLSPLQLDQLLIGLSERAEKLPSGSALFNAYAVLKKETAEKDLSVHFDDFANGLRSGLSPEENAGRLDKLDSMAKWFDQMDIRNMKDAPVIANDLIRKRLHNEVKVLTPTQLMSGLDALNHNTSSDGSAGAITSTADRAARAGETLGEMTSKVIKRTLESLATKVYKKHLPDLERNLYGLNPGKTATADSKRAVELMFTFAEMVGESASLESRILENVGYEPRATLQHALGNPPLDLRELFDMEKIDIYQWLGAMDHELEQAKLMAQPATESELAANRTHSTLAVLVNTFLSRLNMTPSELARVDPIGMQGRKDVKDALAIQFSNLAKRTVG
ncbi:MAG: hypothetical protein JWQ23_1863 [Herminiimonas sp.]|nr:hypothetical protein [Herminiimonas sp.]